MVLRCNSVTTFGGLGLRGPWKADWWPRLSDGHQTDPGGWPEPSRPELAGYGLFLFGDLGVVVLVLI